MSHPAAERSRTVELFLELSVLRYSIDPKTSEWSDHGGPYPHDSPERQSEAAAVLAQNPSIAQDSIHTAVVARDVERVRAFLDEDPSLASTPRDFDGWRPLMRLAYTRLPSYLPSPIERQPTEARGAEEGNLTSSPSLIIARLLLEAGADPSGGPLKGDAKDFTALTGVIGGGEYGQKPHPKAEALARLLIEYGADPLDGQALYNTSLHDQESGRADDGDDVSWLEFLWEEDIRRHIKKGKFGSGEERYKDDNEEARNIAETQVCARWREPLSNSTLPSPPLVYLLHSAVMQRQPRRVKWLLKHGGDADASIDVGSGGESGSEMRRLTLVEVAEEKSYDDIAELLSRYGDLRLRSTGGEM